MKHLMKPAEPSRRAQKGAATLLVALVLMMSLTVVTLSVAHTQLVEQRIASNDQWHTRLSLLAEAGLARASELLEREPDTLVWTLNRARHIQVSKAALGSDVTGVHTQLVLERPADSARFLFQQVTAVRDDGSGISAQASRIVRPLSVLSPLAEAAPPLILNGCVTSAGAHVDVRPRNADGDQPETAVWLNRDRPCPALPGLDLHGGSVADRLAGEDLWPMLFSVDREVFTAMSARQGELAEDERIYWTVQDGELAAGRWLHSLGTAARPVVLYFPPETGCPEFAPGVQVYGVVFIDSECTHSVATHSFAVYGSLAINGHLNAAGSDLQLNHIQIANPLQAQLQFPVLRSVVVPGTWRDF